MGTTKKIVRPCDGCGARGITLLRVKNLSELSGCLLLPKLTQICEHCREEIFLELEALKRQAARMGSKDRRAIRSKQ